MFDRKAIKENFSRAAAGYDAHAALQQEVRRCTKVLAHGYFAEHSKILDLGCGTAALQHKRWDIYGVDISIGMCRVAAAKGARIINAAADSLPLKSESFDGVFSSLMLQWVEKPEKVFAEIMRVLKPEGVAVISTFVEGTLAELKEAFAEVDSAPHISEFMDGDQLLMRAVHAGAEVLEFSLEAYEQEVENALSLMKSIKHIGAGNKNMGRKKGMMTPKQLAKVQATYNGNIATWKVLTMVLGRK